MSFTVGFFCLYQLCIRLYHACISLYQLCIRIFLYHVYRKCLIQGDTRDSVYHIFVSRVSVCIRLYHGRKSMPQIQCDTVYHSSKLDTVFLYHPTRIPVSWYSRTSLLYWSCISVRGLIVPIQSRMLIGCWRL